MDTEEVLELVRDDVVRGLGTDENGGLNSDDLIENFDALQASPDRPDLPDLPGALVFGDDVGVLAWTTEAVHDGVFQEIAPTGHPIKVTGCTYVIGADGASAQYVRFVDWASVLAQMGVTFNTKPLVDEELLAALDDGPPVVTS